MAWALGWQQAQSASGSWWMPPYLSLLMRDPYDVVRYRAHQSLKTLDGYASIDYRSDSSEREVMDVVQDIRRIWKELTPDSEGNTAELLIRDGSRDFTGVQHLMRRRDNRPMYLQE